MANASKNDDPPPRELVEGLRKLREEARRDPEPRPELPPRNAEPSLVKPLPSLRELYSDPAPRSPDRETLNASWNAVELARAARSAGLFRRLTAPFGRWIARVVASFTGPVAEKQVEWNSAQVRFDNELVEYLDARLDGLSQNYDRVLGLHGKRMEEIDERHLILQQELIRHVHDLVERIEFVFESAEQNHLYLEATLRETREELDALRKRIDSMVRTPSGND